MSEDITDQSGGEREPLVIALRIADPGTQTRVRQALADVAAFVIAEGSGDADLILSDGGFANEAEIDEEANEPTTRRLSDREIEVLQLMSTGASNKVIARELDISVHTAKFHVTSIMTKLNATSRTDAVARAMRANLLLI